MGRRSGEDSFLPHTSWKVTGRDRELAAVRSLPEWLPTGITDHTVDVAALFGEVPEEASTAFSEHSEYE